MSIFAKIERNRYIDSLETLFATTVLNEQPGITVGAIGMATDVFKDTLAELGLLSDPVKVASGADYVIVAQAEDQAAFDAAVAAVEAQTTKQDETAEETQTYSSVEEAKRLCPEANLCSIAVPGEYALSEVKKALNAGLHCVVFSNNVPLEDEREMKELAREKGLLCMGPDCGVANINGAALVLASVNNRGPFGICGASGVGIQHVAAMLHDAGTGVSQTIGTGGNDLKEPVGGLMMLEGIDALESDPETKYFVLISRKPADSVLKVLLERISRCKKPRVVYFMGCDRETVEATGAIWAADLDDCGQKALALEGLELPLESEAELHALAVEAVKRLSGGQKYVRGNFSGGTFMDGAMRAMTPKIGKITSNKPLKPEWQLKDSFVSEGNCCIDYGEEEFTLGRPHPAIDVTIREPAIIREAEDPEVAVILLDVILTPPGHPDPCGSLVPQIEVARRKAAERGNQLIFVASVLGTDRDFQDVNRQRQTLRDAGVLVCSTNHRAALLAGEIIKLKQEADEDEH